MPIPAAPGTDATVAGRYIFFNHSAFDGNDAAANASDDAAVSPAVAALLPNQAASLSNLSNYSRGLNGVMVDVDHLAAGSLSLDDFAFRIGNSPADPANWSPAPAPSSITVRRGAEADGTDRVTLVWPDGAIRNAWLQVSVLDTPDTGLAAPDVFYFGSLPGDAGALGAAPTDITDAGDFTVSVRDLVATRRGMVLRGAADVSSPLDHNHDGRVDTRDYVVVRQNLNSRLERLLAPGQPPVYYVSPTGDDAGDGLGPLSAWRTAAKVNATPLLPGAHVLFQRAGEWHEQLAVPSSGTPAAPVVFGSYGAGLKPKFWGSDPLDASAFELVGGTAWTYRILPAGAIRVNSVQADHAFLISSARPTGSPDLGPNLDYVSSHPNSWYQDEASGFVYVNTGGRDPRDGSVLYTASVRNNVVLVEGRHDVVLRNLVVDESAQFNGGYAFTVLGADDVTIEGCEAYRAGKHHFGVIDSGGFVGRDLYAAWAMPGQLFGESSSFVSYSDYPYVNKDSTWINCVSEELPWAVRPHLAFYTHGTGVRDVTVENMVSRGGVGISVATNAPGEHVRITGGEIVDGRLTLNGSGVFVDGVTLRGPHAGITLVGSDNLVQNVLIDGAVPDFGDSGAVVNYGGGNTFRFSTVRIDPASGWPAAAFVLKTFWWATGPRIYGNIIDAPRAFRLQNDPPEAFTSDHNLFAREPEFMMSDGSVRDLAKWRAELGQDGSSVVADPLFADPAAGDLSLREGSPAVDAFEPTDLLEGIAIDLLGTPRPQGAAYDLGALERRG